MNSKRKTNNFNCTDKQIEEIEWVKFKFFDDTILCRAIITIASCCVADQEEYTNIYHSENKLKCRQLYGRARTPPTFDR